MEKEQLPVFYITRDIERALGVWPLPEHFYIVTNRTPYAEEKAKTSDHIFLIQEEKVLDTHEFLMRDDVTSWIRARALGKKPGIIVFKNTSKIEDLCRGLDFTLLNPAAELSQKIEEKISQTEWLGDLTSLMPLFSIVALKDLVWNDQPFILQFNHGHTGNGTFLIESKEALHQLATKFPDRIVKKSTYRPGPVFTVTSVVFPNVVLVGNVNYQITGLAPFTTEPFSTIGNDWSFANTSLAVEERGELHNMAEAIGNRMRESGWRGAFGIDAILDSETGNFLLLEINARQPAGAVYESWLQGKERDASNAHEATLIEAHYRSLIGGEPASSLVEISKGAQIILRGTPKILAEHGGQLLGDLRKKQTALEALGLTVIPYRNTEPNSDILRIQSGEGVVESHGVLNSLGKEIRDIVI